VSGSYVGWKGAGEERKRTGECKDRVTKCGWDVEVEKKIMAG
jgi:hypothetical protein